MKIIISEKQLRTLLFENNNFEKYTEPFNDEMSKYINLDWAYMEFWDLETDKVYDRKHYYIDIDEDWEEDNWIFSLGNEENNEYELFYDKWLLRDEIVKFPLLKFEKLLSDWFMKTYGYKLYKVDGSR